MLLVVDKRGLLLEPGDIHLWLGSHSNLEANHAALFILDNAWLLNDRWWQHVILANASLVTLELQDNVGNALAQFVDGYTSVGASIRVLGFLSQVKISKLTQDASKPTHYRQKCLT